MNAAEFEALSAPYFDMLYRHALSLTRNKTEAEDLLQEAILKAFRASHLFEKGTNIKAWLFKILRNTFISEWRRKKHDADTSFTETDEEFSIYTEAYHHQGDSDAMEKLQALTPETMEQEFGDEIMKALESLPADFKEAVLLCDVQEFTYQEIAEILEIPIGTVRSRLARARALLQKHLWDYACRQGLWRRPS